MTVNKANAVITWPTASSLTYGQTLAASTLSGGSATPTGTFAFTTPSTVPNAGTTPQSVTFTPTNVNFNTATNNVNVTVAQATSTVTVTCPVVDQTYTGSALTPCTASYSGAGGLSGSLTPTYSNNTNVGTATANAVFAGDTNHTGSNGSDIFVIVKASSTVTVSCPVNAPYTGSALTPCTASYSGAGGLSGSLTPTYSNNTNVGTATANASYAGDANHNASNNSATFEIIQATPILTVTNSPAVFTGSPRTAIVTGSVPGVVSNVKYDGSSTAPTNIGTYAVTANFTSSDPNYKNLTNASAGNFVISNDVTPPTVLSSVRVNPSPTGLASVDFTVTFSESVMGVDMTGPAFDDFALTTTGVSGAAVSGVSGSGSVYTVTVNTGSGSGTIRLDVPDTATITDLVGNPLSGLPFITGEIYTINKNVEAYIGGNLVGSYAPDPRWKHPTKLCRCGQWSGESDQQEWNTGHLRHPQCLGGQRRHHQLLAVDGFAPRTTLGYLCLPRLQQCDPERSAAHCECGYQPNLGHGHHRRRSARDLSAGGWRSRAHQLSRFGQRSGGGQRHERGEDHLLHPRSLGSQRRHQELCAVDGSCPLGSSRINMSSLATTM